MGRNSNLPVYVKVAGTTSNNIGSSFVAVNLTAPVEGRIRRARAVITTAHSGAANVFLRVGTAAVEGSPATLDTILEYGTTANPIDDSDLAAYYKLTASASNPNEGTLYVAVKVDAGTASVVGVSFDIELVA